MTKKNYHTIKACTEVLIYLLFVVILMWISFNIANAFKNKHTHSDIAVTTQAPITTFQQRDDPAYMQTYRHKIQNIKS